MTYLQIAYITWKYPLQKDAYDISLVAINCWNIDSGSSSGIDFQLHLGGYLEELGTLLAGHTASASDIHISANARWTQSELTPMWHRLWKTLGYWVPAAYWSNSILMGILTRSALYGHVQNKCKWYSILIHAWCTVHESYPNRLLCGSFGYYPVRKVRSSGYVYKWIANIFYVSIFTRYDKFIP